MPNCHEMNVGEVYGCPDCGLELKVVKACKSVENPQDSCGCGSAGDPATLTCCGRELVKKG